LRPLSIQARWTLRYGAALLVVSTLFAVYAYARISRRIDQDARLLIELQTDEILEEIRQHPGDRDAIAEYVDQHIESAGSQIQLGIAVFDPSGAPRIARGVLAERPLTLPPEALAQALADPEQRWEEIADLGSSHPFRVTTVRVPEGIVQIALSQKRFDASIRSIRNIFLVAIPIMLAVSAAAGLVLARGSLRPIAAITTTARRITGSNLDERIPTTGSGDELDQLAATLNAMIQRLAEGMERMRRFSADAAHELRTPLAALRSQIEVTLEKERAPDEYRRVLAGLLDETALLTDAVHGMLRLASSEAGIDPARRVLVSIPRLLEEVLDFFAPVAEDHGVRRVRNEAPDVRVPGDPTWLHQLFANLVHNAVKYTPRGGEVRVDARAERRAGRPRQVVVEVRDSGVGIPAAEHDRIFERFHRLGARQDAPGAGLGLPIAREIARAHGGSIELESAPGRGSVFRVRLPTGEPDATGPRAATLAPR
jgi:heavy metal sensor kinase